MNAMLRLLALSALMTSVVGCADQRSLQARSPVPEQSRSAPDSSPIIPTLPQQPDGIPRLVVPVTGDGTPVMAIPFGGMIYAPVTGGPPILATPLTP